MPHLVAVARAWFNLHSRRSNSRMNFHDPPSSRRATVQGIGLRRSRGNPASAAEFAPSNGGMNARRATEATSEDVALSFTMPEQGSFELCGILQRKGKTSHNNGETIATNAP